MKKYQNRVSRGECLAGALLWTLVLAVQAVFFSMSDEAWSRRVWDCSCPGLASDRMLCAAMVPLLELR